MMPAVKMLDPIMGIDIHMVAIPAVPSPIPTPMPHPYVGMVFEAMSFIPMIGASIKVQGMPCATAGTSGKAIVPHIPMGGPFLPPIPTNDSEIFMGSATVLFEGSPAAFTALPCLSCNTFGMPPPPRKKGGAKVALELPTSMVVAIPMGLPVLIGGPPTIDMSLMVAKAKAAIKGKLLKKLQNTKMWKAVSQKIHNFAKKVMDKLKIPKKSKIRDLVHDYICSKTGHPVDIASGKVTTEHIDFAFPGPIPFEWKRWYSSASSYDGPLGVGWHHPYDMALAEDHRVVAVRMEDGRVLLSARLGVGESHYDRSEKRTLFRDERGYGLRDHADRTTHRFCKAGRDGVQRLTSIENDFGETIQLEYDNDLFLTGIVDSTGRRLRLVNDHRGKIRSILVPHPTLPGEEGERPSVEIVQYLVDSSHDLVEVFDAQKRPWKFRYSNHLLISETLRNGLTFQFQYKGSGITARCVRTWGDGGIYDHKLKYNLVQGHTVVTTSLGARTEHHHENGVVREVVDAMGGRSSTLWNTWMEPFATLDELGRGTLTEFDDRGNAVKMIEADGSTLEVAYEDDLPVNAIDAVGGQWLWKHDQGRLVERTDPLGRTTRYEYEGSRLIASLDAKGNKTEFAYDPQGNLVKANFPDGSANEWVHDRWGNLWSALDERGNRRDFAYDLSGNVRKIREPDGNLREMDYDPEDNLIRAKDAHREVSFTWRGMGAMASRTENGTRIDFAYDTEDQLTAIRNEVQDIYGFKRDLLGRVELEQGWDGLQRTFRYDAVGNLVRVERPGERWTEYDNDAAGRVLEVRHWDESTQSFVYRTDGELVEAENAHAKILWERDPLGRVLKEVQGNHWVESIWNELDERVEIRSSLGAHQIIDRDLMGEAATVQVPGNPEDPTAPPKWEAKFQRDISGLEIERALPGGIKSRWERDQHGRPLRHSFGKKDKERNREYTWAVDDRLKKIVDSAYGPVEFEHDAFGNLSGATYNDFHKLWRTPDVLGNLFRTPERLDRNYGPSGQLLESTSTQGLTRYEYDAEGNLIKKTITPPHSPEPTMVLGSGTGLGSGPNADKIWLYEWNAAGHLSRVIRPDGQIVEFLYDPLGRRVSKSFAGRTTHWVWDGNLPLHEWQEETGPLPKIEPPPTYAMDARLAEVLQLLRDKTLSPLSPQGPPERPSEQSPITWLFEPDCFAPMARLQGERRESIVCDHLGTPLAMFNDAGNQTWSLDLDIYGQPRMVEGERGLCPFRYPGQYEDAETGLYYNRFRYFDPEAGGYISQDPIRLEGGNPTLYGYVGDPNGWVDWLGLACRPQNAQQELRAVGRITGKTNAQIEAILRKRGYKQTPARSGGSVWSKKMPKGKTAVVRLDPAKPATKAKKADENPHSHKEIFASSKMNRRGNSKGEIEAEKKLNDA
ncbi:MAG: hypothetical protein IPO40_13665 [Fibrobacteres bacterium]|nr:hypothetical protein [Fibrobacterota bacterium]